MSSPLPPEIITPEGKPAFLNPYSGAYTTNRAYARRMQRGFSRGLTQQEARGQGVNRSGLSEYQRRQQYAFTFQQQYGFSVQLWNRLRRLGIDEINAMSSPGMQITPEWVQQELENQVILGQATGLSGEPWLEQRITEKAYDMEQYRQGNSTPGFVSFHARDGIRPVEWWFYR